MLCCQSLLVESMLIKFPVLSLFSGNQEHHSPLSSCRLSRKSFETSSTSASPSEQSSHPRSTSRRCRSRSGSRTGVPKQRGWRSPSSNGYEWRRGRPLFRRLPCNPSGFWGVDPWAARPRARHQVSPSFSAPHWLLPNHHARQI